MSPGWTTTASTSTWTEWNYYYTLSTTTSATSTVWAYWNTDYTTSATGFYVSADNVTWREWNMGWNAAYIQDLPASNLPTEEEIRMDIRMAAELEAARSEELRFRLLEHAEAENRAEALLRENLNQAQLAEFNKDLTFTVHSKDGVTQYRIKKGWSHNIERIHPTKKKVTLCAHPTVIVPEFDNMLVQKLALEHDEDGFLKVANVGR